MKNIIFQLVVGPKKLQISRRSRMVFLLSFFEDMNGKEYENC